MIHVLQHGIEAVFVNESVDEIDPLIVGSDLCPQIALNIAEAASSTASRVLRWLLDEDANELVPLVLSFVNDLERNDGGAFLEKSLGCWRHGAGQNSPDIFAERVSAFVASAKGSSCDTGGPRD